MNIGLLRFLGFGIIDALDIILVTVLIYQFLKLFRGTRAPYIFIGVLIVIAVGVLAQVLDFPSLSWIIDAVKTIALVALVIIFQPEIRRALGLVGQRPFFRGLIRESVPIDRIADASCELRERGLGAIIVIERRMGLREFTEEAVPLNTEFSVPLLISLLLPDSPLHDGAVIIRESTILAAKAILPVSRNLPPELYGTRHRAAVGITEVSDAIAIVVSEENRNIRACVGGRLSAPLSKEGLLSFLDRELGNA
ncbi:MAG: diadenylate cyclase CdaA [candidate division WOR-3 bacterium]